MSNRNMKDIKLFLERMIATATTSELKCEVFAKSTFRLINPSSPSAIETIRSRPKKCLTLKRPDTR